MKLTVINSGSVGNCYLMQASDGETLIIELGVAFKTIKQTLNFNLSQVCGAIVSHNHGDHSKGCREALLAGIDTYMSRGAAGALGLEHHRLHYISHSKRFKVGKFDILPFDIVHDCPEPLGFLIRHPESGTTCFITDSAFVEYQFPGLNNIIIEANYCPVILESNRKNGNLNAMVYDRVKKSHLSIDTCQEFLKANDLSKVINILLIHLSDSNSNAADFKAKIQKQTAKIVNVAEKGLCIPFNLTAF